MNDKLLSVIITAYNQENFIRQAIDSVLNQKTQYDYEIIIGEDCSQDRTKEILIEYENKFPDRIKVFYNAKNLGIVGNWHSTISKANGFYIGVCEGDDYWTDQYKIEKQMTYLLSNPDCGMICTNFSKFYEINGQTEKNCFNYKRYVNGINYNDFILDRGTIMSGTVIFKKELYTDFDRVIPLDLRIKWKMPDTPLWLFIAKNSKIDVISDSTAEYRIQINSGSKNIDEEKHFLYVLNGYEIPLYFTEKLYPDKKLTNKLHKARLNFALEYAYNRRDLNLLNK